MKIIFATSNAGKIREVKFLFQDLPFTIIPQREMQVDDIEETGLTFIENAILKARHACKATGLPALSDDSGLVIPALNGAPGIYSARYAGTEGNAQNNIEKVLAELKKFPENERQAYFYSVIAFMLHAEDPTPLICQGVWYGHIVEAPQGKDGFGYDPIFYVPTENKTAAEISLERKNFLSHRGQALRQLLNELPKKCNIL